MSKSADFVHLHVHSEYSLLDGACRIPEMVRKAAEFGMPALAITDHGNMFGAIQFYETCEKAGVKPIIGMEAYVAPGSRHEKEAKGIDEASHHLILLAKDLKGYKNLMKLSSLAYLEGFYYRPRIDKELLRQYSEGLICLSSCLAGEVSHWLNREEREKALAVAREFSEIFPKGDYYLEIQDHGIADQRKIIPGVLSLAKELRLPVVATNDLHYLEKSHARAHECLLCVQTQTNMDDPKRFRFETDEFYFKSPEEMSTALGGELKEALLKTREVAEKVDLRLRFDEIHLPQFDPPAGKTQEHYLTELVEEGVKRRYPEVDAKVRQRVDYELSVIRKTGFTSYFLITWDVVNTAKSRGIPVGPGRGSAAGSLVSYCLGITDLDPLEHGLIFERFLNPDRISMPDIDIDFCYERRGEVIDYVTAKYGKGNVAQVITFGTMQAKAVVRDVARALGFTYPEADRIAKMIPFELNMTLKRALEIVPDLRRLAEEDPRVKQLMEVSMNLEGITRHASTHAAGVVIADGDLTDYVPLFKPPEGQVSTAYAMEALEKIGLLKMDFLGLRTLTVLHEASELIRKIRPGFDLEKVPLDDPKTYQMLERAESGGVFQLESGGMRDLMRRLKPSHFQDLIALVALFRPGPLGSGMVDDFIRRRHGQLQVSYDHPKLEPILKDTYGICLYQEGVMRIAHEVAGFTLAEADGLRKAMGKKNPEIMEKAKQKFVDGCVMNGVDRRTAQKIFDKIEYFAGYAFNRSHSAAYALISYRTAYLKANFPVEFMTALLTSERDNTAKIAEYVEEARRMKIDILPPDVNRSFARFTVEDGAIRYGLLGVKNVGEKAIESIIQSRQEKGPFTSLPDFCERVDARAVNRKVIESLIRCGAFDSLKLKRAQLMAILERSMELGSQRQKAQAGGQLSFFEVFGRGAGESKGGTVEIPEIDEWPEAQMLAFEKALLGFYLTGHPLARYEEVLQLYSKSTTASLRGQEEGTVVTVGGVVTKLKVTTTKKGNERMAIISIDDFHGSVEALIFPKVLPQVEQHLAIDSVLLVTGRISAREDPPKLLVQEVVPLEEAGIRKTQSIRIRLSRETDKQGLQKLKETLQNHPGQVPVEFSLANGPQGDTRVAAGLRVAATTELFRTLIELVGSQSISVVSPPPGR